MKVFSEPVRVIPGCAFRDLKILAILVKVYNSIP